MCLATSSESSLSCLRAEMGMKRVLATLLDRQLCDAHGVVDRVYPAAEVKTTDGYEATPEALLEQGVAKETQGARYRLQRRA